MGQKTRSQRAVRKGISALPNDIFPDGKVKYFLWKCEILLTQYEICPNGHIVVSLRDD
jgi:hypothetical protein